MVKIYSKFSEDSPRPKTDFTIKKDSKGKVTNPESISKAVQADKNAADINKIVAKAKKTGFMVVNNKQPMYGDFTKGTDYADVQKRILEVKNGFEGLPAEIRNKFDNSPEKWIDYMSDPNNKEESIELGLRPKPKMESKVEGDNIVLYKDGVEVERKPKQPSGGSTPSGSAGSSAGPEAGTSGG